MMAAEARSAACGRCKNNSPLANRLPNKVPTTRSAARWRVDP